MIPIRISRANNHFYTLQNMMKARLAASEKFKKRVEDKARDKNFDVNKADLLFVGNDTQEFPPSLLVSSGKYSYLFNCAEGTQRSCYSNGVKLINLEHMFVTNRQWNRVSGAYGLSLTLQDAGSPNLTVHMMDGTEGLFDTVNKFISYFSGMRCEVDTNLTEYQDAHVRIQPIPLETSTKHDEDNHHVPKMSKLRTKLIAYSCQLPDGMGALYPEKCKQLNVPVGKHLARLKLGMDIKLPDGTVVKSSDVCGPKSPGLNFIVIECPSLDDIESVTKNPTISQLRGHRTGKNEREVGVVVHYGPQSVIQDPRYRQWIDGFSEGCKHLIVDHDNKTGLHYGDSYRLQHLLRKFDDKIFPELYMSDETRERIDKESGNTLDAQSMRECICQQEGGKTPQIVENDKLNQTDRFIHVNSMDRFVFRPKTISESIKESPIDTIYQEVQLDPHFEECLSELRGLQANLPEPKEYEPEVVFLGTGSAVPSKYRNTSCILINFRHSKASVILDCGEDAYGQLSRFYGPDKVCEILKQLKMIYVSHHHADHHVGLTEIIRQRRRYTDEPVLLLLPPNVDSILNYHNYAFEDLRESYDSFSTLLLRKGYASFEPTQEAIIKKTGGMLEHIDMIPVEHCHHSCAVVMRFKIGKPGMDSFTIAYSGDARPSREFAVRGTGCDLLIHEATFEHRMEDDALVKKHSTSREAIRVAKEMKAKFTILTHFSQRLPKIPYFTDEFDDSIGFAFDNLALRCPSHFARLPILKPICSLAFKSSLDDCDVKYYKSQRKQSKIDDILKSAEELECVQ